MDFGGRLQAKMQELIDDGRVALDHVLERPPVNETSSEKRTERDPAEAIHDLRVALRRLRSVLRPMQIVYGKRQLSNIEEELRAILDLTSELRDEEVLRETLSALSLDETTQAALRVWMTGRARRERGLRTRATRALSQARPTDSRAEPSDLRPTDVARCLDALAATVGQGPKRAIELAELQRVALGRALERLEQRAEAAKIQDAVSMHRVRIGAKRLRYVAELLSELAASENEGAGQADGTPSPDGAELVRIGKSSARIQKRLGQLHDFDEALSRMGRAWGLDRAPRSEVLKALGEARRATGAKAQAELAEELKRTRVGAARLLDERRARGSVVGARARTADEDATG